MSLPSSFDEGRYPRKLPASSPFAGNRYEFIELAVNVDDRVCKCFRLISMNMDRRVTVRYYTDNIIVCSYRIGDYVCVYILLEEDSYPVI